MFLLIKLFINKLYFNYEEIYFNSHLCSIYPGLGLL